MQPSIGWYHIQVFLLYNESKIYILTINVNIYVRNFDEVVVDSNQDEMTKMLAIYPSLMNINLLKKVLINVSISAGIFHSDIVEKINRKYDI